MNDDFPFIMLFGILSLCLFAGLCMLLVIIFSAGIQALYFVVGFILFLLLSYAVGKAIVKLIDNGMPPLF